MLIIVSLTFVLYFMYIDALIQKFHISLNRSAKIKSNVTVQRHRKQSKELQDKLIALLDLSNLLIQSRVVKEHSDKLMVIQLLLLKGIVIRYDVK